MPGREPWGPSRKENLLSRSTDGTDTVQTRLRSRIWVLVLVFVLATVVSFAYFAQSGSAQKYRTQGVIPPPASVTNPAEALQYVADLRGALGSDLVAARVARRVGTTKADIKKHLTSARRGDSAIVEVAYVTKDASADAGKVLVAAVDETARFLAEGRSAASSEQIDAAEANVAKAAKAQATADAAVDAFLVEHGGAAPDEALSAVETQLVDLRVAQLRAEAAGEVVAATTAQRSLDALTAQLAGLRAQATEFAPLRRAADAAEARVTEAEQVRSTALGDAQDVLPAFHVEISARGEKVSETGTWLRQSLAVGAAAAVIAAVLVAWVPLRSRSRRGRDERPVAAGFPTG